MPRGAQRLVPLPVIAPVVDDDALHGERCVVSAAGGSLAVIAPRHGDAPAIRVEQHLVRVETQPARRLVRAIGAVRVHLAILDAGHKDVPVVARAVAPRIQPDHPRWLGVIHIVEEKQL
jgi:hypothetical protein